MSSTGRHLQALPKCCAAHKWTLLPAGDIFDRLDQAEQHGEEEWDGQPEAKRQRFMVQEGDGRDAGGDVKVRNVGGPDDEENEPLEDDDEEEEIAEDDDYQTVWHGLTCCSHALM